MSLHYFWDFFFEILVSVGKAVELIECDLHILHSFTAYVIK